MVGVDDKDYTTNSTQVNRRVSPTIKGTDLYQTLDEYEEFIKLDDLERHRHQQLQREIGAQRMATNRKRILNMMLDSEVKLNKLRALATSAAGDDVMRP